jgi:hypothetical protein
MISASNIVNSSISFLEAVASLNQQWKDNYKQVTLNSLVGKSDKPPPPADIFANLPGLGSSSFSFS